jgi:protein phosphatase
MTRTLEIPELSLVVLVGASGSGKSTFAREHFLGTEVVSSDFCRGLVSDDENAQDATNDAFELLHYIAGKRMTRGRLTVVDATNVQPEARKPLVGLARKHHFLPVAIVFDLPERLCQDRNRARPDRDFGPHVIRNQTRQLKRSMRGLKREGFRQIHVLETPEAIADVSITRTPLWNNKKTEHGPFDIFGDVHGCADELEELLALLGYEIVEQRPDGFPEGGAVYAHPKGRRAIFVGDLVDRGPRILDALQIARNMVEHGSALCVPGNHDQKLVRALRGRDVQITHGLDRSLGEIDGLPDGQREAARSEVVRFLDSLVSHYVFDDGNLVVAHAGMKEEMQGRGSGKVRDFALYGETTGETDEFGLPVRWNWAAEYRGQAIVVYGHTPVPEPEWLNRTINIDTGCVFGGRLTALRYPEKELVSVPARAVYSEPAKPFVPEEELPERLTSQQREDELLDIEDVLGKRYISTRLGRNVTIREENAIAALEVVGRFAVNPKWLVYLPPRRVAVCNQPGTRPARAPEGGVLVLPPRRSGDGDLRGEAHGFTRSRCRVQGRTDCTAALRRRRRGLRRLLHPDRTPLLRRRRTRGGLPRACPARGRRSRALLRVGNGLARPRRRAHAVVGQGSAAAA